MEKTKRVVRFGWFMGRPGDTIDHPHTPFIADESRQYHIEFKTDGPSPKPETPKTGVINARSLKHWGTDELPRFLLQEEEERQKDNPTKTPQAETETPWRREQPQPKRATEQTQQPEIQTIDQVET